MCNIYEAEELQEKIESHPHFGACFNGSDYDDFNYMRNELGKCKSCFEGLNSIEKEIIEENNMYQNKKNELNNIKEVNQKEYENLKNKYNNEEEINRKNYERQLKNIINQYENHKLKRENELIQLEEDIFNLNEEIELLKEKLDSEIELKKKEIINKLYNENKIKLLEYKNKKELEKQKIESELLILKKEFEANKEIELNELKKKAELVMKIIYISKNMSLYN